MRAGELLGRRVALPDGRELGVITDIRTVVEEHRGGTDLRLDALLVSPHRAGATLGYRQGRTHGPAPVAAIVRWLHRGMVLIPWSSVVLPVPSERDEPLRLSTASAVRPVPDL